MFLLYQQNWHRRWQAATNTTASAAVHKIRKKDSLHRFIRSNELDARRFQPSPLRSHSVEIRVNTVFCTWSRITLPPECQDLCQVCIIASKQKPVCRELDYWPALEPVVQNIYNGAVGVMHAATVHWPTQTGQSHTHNTQKKT